MTRLVPILALGALGCRSIEPVPDDLDGLMHRAWIEMAEGEDAVLAEVQEGLHALLAEASLEEPVEGTLSTLSREEVAWVGDFGDPSLAAGVVLGAAVGCALPRLEATLSHPDQDELYPGSFDAFSRSYEGDREAFLAGDERRLAWTTEYAVSSLAASYSARTRSELLRVAEVGLMRVTVLQEPAEFDNANTNSFIAQDYHLEFYWPDGEGVQQAYALWRHSQIAGFEDEDEGAQRITLNLLVDWDEETASACASLSD